MTLHHSSVVRHPFPVVVVGGGLSGLIASTLVARAGLSVVLLEKSAAVGGRAASRTKDGFVFNLGPHALYRAGHLRKTLKVLGIDIRGAVPGANGGFVLLGGRRHTLPAGLASLLTTGALTLHGKFELARVQSRLPAVDAASIQHETLASWLDSQVADAGVRGLLEMLVRVTTFTNDPEHQSAGAAIEQLQLALRASVLYLDGGWQTIVDGLRRAAVDSGVRIIQGAHAVALDRSAERVIDAVRLADGTGIGASAVILGGAPADVDALARTTFSAELPPPIRVATLDVALRSLPKTNATVAFGVDGPLYFSVHSAVAALAPPGGAMIHVSKYSASGRIGWTRRRARARGVDGYDAARLARSSGVPSVSAVADGRAYGADRRDRGRQRSTFVTSAGVRQCLDGRRLGRGAWSVVRCRGRQCVRCGRRDVGSPKGLRYEYHEGCRG